MAKNEHAAGARRSYARPRLVDTPIQEERRPLSAWCEPGSAGGEPATPCRGTRPPWSLTRHDAGRCYGFRPVAVAVGLAALTAAACVLSYSSVHHFAMQAGVSASLARIYPLIFDAMLAVAGCSVLALRGAGCPWSAGCTHGSASSCCSAALAAAAAHATRLGLMCRRAGRGRGDLPMGPGPDRIRPAARVAPLRQRRRLALRPATAAPVPPARCPGRPRDRARADRAAAQRPIPAAATPRHRTSPATARAARRTGPAPAPARAPEPAATPAAAAIGPAEVSADRPEPAAPNAPCRPSAPVPRSGAVRSNGRKAISVPAPAARPSPQPTCNSRGTRTAPAKPPRTAVRPAAMPGSDNRARTIAPASHNPSSPGTRSPSRRTRPRQTCGRRRAFPRGRTRCGTTPRTPARGLTQADEAAFPARTARTRSQPRRPRHPARPGRFPTRCRRDLRALGLQTAPTSGYAENEPAPHRAPRSSTQPVRDLRRAMHSHLSLRDHAAIS